MEPPTCLRFADFEVSRRERQLRRRGAVVPLIPRYFDLLVLLIERRPSVVSRSEIFDEVWRDVIVSDGALSQAVRTLRRTLGDHSREPVYIRTVSRHGYSFVFQEVREEPEGMHSRVIPAAEPSHQEPPVGDAAIDGRITALLDQLTARETAGRLEVRRDLAVQLHALGTARVLRALSGFPSRADALALLRDTRWDVPEAGAVPLWREPGGLAAGWALVRLRAADAAVVLRRRWARAALGGGVAGLLAGAAGGSLLWLAPASNAPATAIVVLAALGAVAGLVAAAGVAAGIAVAEAVARSHRVAAIVGGGAMGGLVVGVTATALARWTLDAVFGLRTETGGALEGLCLGAGVAAGYAISTPRPEGGIAALSGRARRVTALSCAACGAAAALALALAGRPLVGGTIHAVAQAFQGSADLTPLGAWIGEPSFGAVSQAVVAAFEGGAFGLGLSWGLTRRLRAPARA